MEIEYEPFFDNEFQVSERRSLVREPSTGKYLADVGLADEVMVNRAVLVADKAFGEWRRTTAKEREGLLNAMADGILDNKAFIATLEARNTGKLLREAEGDVEAAAQTLRYYGGWATRIYGDVLPRNNTSLDYVISQPLGVCGAIIPWNFPLLIACWKIAPALATGNTVVIKPASNTPLSSLILAAIAREKGFPPGVLNVLPGPGGEVGMAIVKHSLVRKVAFTGDGSTGELIMAAAATGPKPVTLELGGKSPGIVFDDADLDRAAKGTSTGIFAFAGQKCAARSRIYVQRSVYAEFLDRLGVEAAQLKVGNPLDPSTQMGPVISEEALERILSLVKMGITNGARLVTGGERISSDGYFIQPTVMADVSESNPVAVTEVFGPVVSVHVFDDEEEALSLANASEFGLTATVWTNNLARAHRLSEGLEAGTVTVNSAAVIDISAPFGGFKRSGFGRDLGRDALLGYTQTKHISIALT